MKPVSPRVFTGALILVVLALLWIDSSAREANRTARIASDVIEGLVFDDAVSACEKAESAVPFRWRSAKKSRILGLHVMKVQSADLRLPYLLLSADGLNCAYFPFTKRAQVGDDEAFGS